LVVAGWWGSAGAPGFRTEFAFRNEGDVKQSSTTPLLGGSVSGGRWRGDYWWGPPETDMPASNLVFGNWWTGPSDAMDAFTIPQHGSRLRNISTNYAATLRLPGAINVSFHDGNVRRCGSSVCGNRPGIALRKGRACN
jgi:hypothetical protein